MLLFWGAGKTTCFTCGTFFVASFLCSGAEFGFMTLFSTGITYDGSTMSAILDYMVLLTAIMATDFIGASSILFISIWCLPWTISPVAIFASHCCPLISGSSIIVTRWWLFMVDLDFRRFANITGVGMLYSQLQLLHNAGCTLVGQFYTITEKACVDAAIF